jgi:sugar-specific transcriptional regulator TrmB
MNEKLSSLGLNQKEMQVYMYLVEYGISAASEVARHIAIPKSTVNFLADSLWKK